MTPSLGDDVYFPLYILVAFSVKYAALYMIDTLYVAGLVESERPRHASQNPEGPQSLMDVD